MFSQRLKSWLLASIGMLTLLTVHAEQPARIQLQIGMHLIQAELAADGESRSRGLMYRTQLDKNNGMLFVFDTVEIHSMWMKNTLLPLSVAFLDKNGAIINIEEMKPLTEISHAAAAPAKYALEMNGQWFSQRGIKAGDKVTKLPK